MKYNIYLDDVRTPISPNNEWVDGLEEWTVVRSYEEFVSKVSEIGLKNIKRQLDLLYPKNSLEINDSNNLYSVSLKILFD
jgi:hypothetical protein